MKPILFNTEMVRAILDGRKTTTRRAIKPHYRNDEYGFNVCTNKDTGEQWVEKYDEDERDFEQTRYINSPYEVGDVLYVKETFFEFKSKYEYKADGKHLALNSLIGGKEFFKWHPSIHMPKEAARIFLKVTDVRVEKLQNITDKQCSKEGIYDDYKTLTKEYHDNLVKVAYPKCFSELWDSTIKKQNLDCYGWDANPFVWVIEFEKCTREDESE